MIAMAFLAAALASEPPPPSLGCTPSPFQPAAGLDFAPTGAQGQKNAEMLISAAVLLQIRKADAAHARAAVEPCLLGSIQAAGSSWELTGGDRAYVRRAVSRDPAKPVAFVYPFADLAALTEASKAHTPPPPTRFVLVTSRGSLDTLWRAYQGLPSDAQLQTDLASAIGGRTRPVATTDVATETVTIMVGPKGG